MKVSVQEITRHASGLQGKSEKQFLQRLAAMADQIIRGLLLRGPYRLVLDANVVMRLESFTRGEWGEGVPATLLGFHLAKRLPVQMDLVIRPPVFYEFLKLRNVTSLSEHWQEIRRLKDMVEQSLGMTLFFDGVETFEGASEHLELIERDASKIAAALKSYESRDWRFDFWRDFGGFAGFPSEDGKHLLVPPKFAAEGLYEPLDLKYFGGAVAPFMIEHIERHLCECPLNDQRIVRRYNKDSDFLLTKVLRLKKNGSLWGLADIDILGCCNLQTQFDAQAHGRYWPASVPMTLDENLDKALKRFSSVQVTTRVMGGGTAREDGRSSLEAFGRDRNRLTEGEVRMEKAASAAIEFLEEVGHWLDVDANSEPGATAT